MLARLISATLRGLDAEIVHLEVDLSRGIPAWSLVGLPDAAVRESKDRVRSALLNSGFDFPLRHITINLAPARMRKDGTHYDLAVAIGVLIASEQIRPVLDPLPFIIGELALDGRLHGVSGALPLAMFARQQGFKTMILPKENLTEVASLHDLQILPATHLLQVARYLQGKGTIDAAERPTEKDEKRGPQLDLADIRGQLQARRALEIAAAGGHHLLMYGPPGVGKSMLAMRLPSILPPLSNEQRLEVSRIYSICNDPSRPPMSPLPPFRAPHHSASDVAIIGGGSSPRPGEVSRAHLGVLFLDELSEYKRQVLEVLRQPLETGTVSIARAADSVTFPAGFQLVAAMNPCPCGYLGHPTRPCSCSPMQVQRYRQRISGPLLDRFDLRIHVPPLDPEELARMQPGESSAAVLNRVMQVRQIQHHRFGATRLNVQMAPREIERYAAPDEAGSKLLHAAASRYSLSARSFHRILRVARTIADLGNRDQVTSEQVAEALQYRGES